MRERERRPHKGWDEMDKISSVLFSAQKKRASKAMTDMRVCRGRERERDGSVESAQR
jgi:hypothetical protein